MSDDLARRLIETLDAPLVGVRDYGLTWIEHKARAIAALIAEREVAARKESCAWADAIERWFIEWEMLPDWSAADPWAELHRMICWEQQVALDPAVSEDARKMIAEERARAFEEAAEAGRQQHLRQIPTTISGAHDQDDIDRAANIAAAIRALAKKEQHLAQEEIALTPQHQRVMRRALAASTKHISEETPDGE